MRREKTERTVIGVLSDILDSRAPKWRRRKATFAFFGFPGFFDCRYEGFRFASLRERRVEGWDEE